MIQNNSNTTWHEVAVRFPCQQEGMEAVLREVFHQLGFGDDLLSLTTDKKHSYLKVYCKTAKESRCLADTLSSFHLKKIRVCATRLDCHDWRDKWKEAVRPFRLTERFDVVPSWNADRYSPGTREPIYLDTILSFGTGLHETTRFMARLIEQRSGKFQTFLDIGTGTGLLSIIGARCGAEELWALDIDAGSIPTARQNLKRNGLAFDWIRQMDFRKFPSTRQFDFIAANVITDELIALKKQIIRVIKPGKYLAVSGISIDNLVRFRKHFSDASLRCLKVMQGTSWAAILYKKIS